MRLLLRLWHRWLTGISARTPAALLLFVFVTGWLAMVLLTNETAITRPGNYGWWFLITTSTIGYGDLAPETAAGRIVASYVVLGGVLTLSTGFTHLANAVSASKGRRMHGTAPLDLTDHVVVLGYHPGRTDRLVADLVDDDRMSGGIALCAWEDQAGSDPLPQDSRTGFIRGDLADVDVLARARIDRARVVLIDPRDDDEGVTLVVAVEEAAPDAHTVVALQDLARHRTVHRVNPAAHCVPSNATRLILEELQDPGVAAIYDRLTMAGGTSTWSSPVPAGGRASYGDWQRALGQAYGATLLAVRRGEELLISPAWSTDVPEGAQLFYVGDHRLGDEDLAAVHR